MTDWEIALCELLAKRTDASVPREMIGFAGGRLMARTRQAKQRAPLDHFF